MIRRLVIAGVAATALAAGSVAAGASSGSPTPSDKELCVVLGGTHSQAYCINWDGGHRTS